MSARWVTFLVWALVAASAAAWSLKLFVTAPSAPPQVAVAGQSQLPRGDVTRVLGADAPPPVDPAAGETLAAPADARFQLVGVVAPRGNETARGGVALIAVDGKPPKAFRIGAVVDGDNVVQAIRARGADLGPQGGKVMVALNIPPPAPPATGTLPDAGVPGAPARPPTMAAPGVPPTPVQRPRVVTPPPGAAPAPPPVTPPMPPSVPVQPGQPANPAYTPSGATPPGKATPVPAQPMGSAQPQLR